MTDATDKKQLRAQYRKMRSEFTLNLTPMACDMAFSVPPSPLAALFSAGKTVAAYIPIATEANPLALLSAAHSAGCQTALPHVTSITSPMRFLQWAPNDVLEKGSFGLKQPVSHSPETQPDIILVPLVAFDRKGNRLGQGAGHYDRALSLLSDAITIGVAWSIQEMPLVPSDLWDIPLDAILTEKEWIIP